MENGTGDLNQEQQLENNDISGSGPNGALTTEEDLLTGDDGFISGTGSTAQQGTQTLGDIQTNLNTQVSDSYDQLNDISQDIQQGAQNGDITQQLPKETMGNVDADGNKSNIGASEKEEAKQGENIFEGIEGL